MAIRISPPQNKTYYINPAYLTFNENSGYGANLIQVSASSSCYISVYDPSNGIGYSDADRNYRHWKVTAYNNRFPSNDRFHIYVRLERDGYSALVIYDTVLRGVKGGEITTSTDGEGNEVKVEGEEDPAYFFVRIGEAGETDGTSIREITYDTGYLTSDEGRDTADLNEMWELDKYSTPWLIRAKQWLQSFTVKGFITLIGGLIFKNGNTEKPVTDVKRSIDDNQTVPINDETIPTTAWVESRTEDRFLKKYEPDETQHRIKFFDGIECGEFVEGPLKVFGGSGTRFDGEGYGEMNGLRLREFLEVPELRFNRIDVVSGILWNSIAFGLIETVDETNQRCTLKLEDGERSGLRVRDICMGIFSDFGGGTVESVFDPVTGEVLDPGDDENGLPKMYGFSTSYFSPTAILQNDAGVFEFEYMLQPGTNVHPKPSMKFAVYGNFSEESRQASAYSTRTYKRYLNKVSTWKIDPDVNIYAQFGKLDGLNIGGQEMTGYGSYQHNSYFSGVQIQFDKEWQDKLQGQDAYSVQLSDNIGVVRMDSNGNLRADEYLPMNVISGEDNVVSQEENVVTSGFLLQTRIQAFKGETELVYAETPSEGCFAVSFSPTGCVAEIANGVISVSEITSLEYSYIRISVSCEGNSTIEKTYQIKVIKDGVASIYADLSNEMDAIACTPEGLYLYGLPVTTTVSMWYGTSRLALDNITLDLPEGVVATADSVTGEISVTEVSEGTPRVLPIGILVQSTHAGEVHVRNLTFTLNKLVQGDAGALYKLVVSNTAIKFQKDELGSVKTVSAKALEYNGKEVSEYGKLPDNMNVTVSIDNDEVPTYTYGDNVEVSSMNASVVFRLWRNGLLVDVVTVPVMNDGESPISADLSNEMDAVSCTADGKYLYGLPLETTASMWSGTEKLEIKSMELELPEGVTAEYDISTGKVTVTGVSDQAAPVLPVGISVSAEHRGVTLIRNLTFTVSKQNQGEAGALYKLIPSTTDVKFNQSQSKESVPVSCGVTWYNGREASEVRKLPEGMSMSYAESGGNENAYNLGEAVAVSASLSGVTFRLYNGSVLLDVETVPVVIDGSSPVTASIENEMDSIACTADGAYVYGLPVKTVVGMWYGTEQLPLDDVSVSAPDGVTCLADNATGEVSVTEVSDEAPKVLPITITMKATKFNVQYERSVVLTVNKQTQGEAGALYRLVTTPDVIKMDKNNSSGIYTVRSHVTWYNGKEVTEYTSETFPESMKITYTIGSGNETTYPYGEEIPVPSDASKITFRLYMGLLLLDVETIPVVLDGNSAFKSTVFLRSNEEPGTPTGGSYEDPKPGEDGWQDGIPRGEEILWASTRVFSIDGHYPQQDAWSKPSSMTSTSGFKVMYCELQTNPGTPDSKPDYWSENSSTDTWWMATNIITNGVWSGWEVSQIRGENGTDGKDGVDGIDGKDGENAKYYTIEASVASIGYTMTGGYSPGSFLWSEYLINGSQKRPSDTNKAVVYGQKGTVKEKIAEYVTVSNQTFNANSYKSKDYDAFIFELVSYPGGNLLASTSVSVGRQGSNGVMPRYCGVYNTNSSYVYDSSYRDIVLYKGNVFQVAAQGKTNMGVAPPDTASSDDNWEVANKFGFVAMDTALIDRANIGGFAFSAKKYENGVPIGVLESQYGKQVITNVAAEADLSSGITISVKGTYSSGGAEIPLEMSIGIRLSRVVEPTVKLYYRMVTTPRFITRSGGTVSCKIADADTAVELQSLPSGFSMTYELDTNSGINDYTLEKGSAEVDYTYGSSVDASGSYYYVYFNLYYNGMKVGRTHVPIGYDGYVYCENEIIPLSVDSGGEVISGLPAVISPTLCWIDETVGITSLDMKVPDGVVVSESRIRLDAETGTLYGTNVMLTGTVNAMNGYIGDWKIADGTMSTEGTYYGDWANSPFKNTLDVSGMLVSINSGDITARFGAKRVSFSEDNYQYYCSTLDIVNTQPSGFRRTDYMCGIHVKGNKDDLGVLIEGAGINISPDAGAYSLVKGLKLRSRTVSSTGTLQTTDDIVLVTGGTVSLPNPGGVNAGKIYFVKRTGGSVYVPYVMGANSSSVSKMTIDDVRPRVFVSAGGYWIEYYCCWE